MLQKVLDLVVLNKDKINTVLNIIGTNPKYEKLYEEIKEVMVDPLLEITLTELKLVYSFPIEEEWSKVFITKLSNNVMPTLLKSFFFLLTVGNSIEEKFKLVDLENMKLDTGFLGSVNSILEKHATVCMNSVETMEGKGNLFALAIKAKELNNFLFCCYDLKDYITEFISNNLSQGE